MMLVLLDVDRFGEEELGLLGGFLESGINKVSKSLGTVFFIMNGLVCGEHFKARHNLGLL